MNFDSCQKGSG